MNSIDILLLIPIIMGAYTGFKRGLLVEVIGILALVIAIVFGFRYLGLGMDLIGEFTGVDMSGKVMPYLSFLLIFFPTIFFVNKLGWAFRKALRLTFLGTMDGIAGAALGAFLWFFGLSSLLWLASTVGLGLPENLVAESEIYPILEGFAPNIIEKLRGILPSAGEIFDQFQELKESAMERA
ncbi:CvpA family protein [Jiulongibacter sediminis]|uniref:CvpA family protein n=1 Tax=Jiulongibacter sediminis TaxID=1605367 RepID=UPI0026F32E3F|nr:CvpA family protein [Jiulongibacter sediminis]